MGRWGVKTISLMQESSKELSRRGFSGDWAHGRPQSGLSVS